MLIAHNVLSPVGPGGMWTVTHRQAVAAGRAVELRHIYRAREERERQAWDDLRGGRVEDALTWMSEHDRIRIYDTRPQMLEGIVDAWWAGNRDGLIVTDTSNAERDSLNELAQARSKHGHRRSLGRVEVARPGLAFARRRSGDPAISVEDSPAGAGWSATAETAALSQLLEVVIRPTE